MFGLTNKSTEPKQNNKKRSRRSKGPALYNEQQNLGAAKVENSKASATRKPLRRTKRKSTKLSEGVAKQANHLASNMREAMVRVTKMRRAERRSRETVAIAKTTPAMTLKRLVRPEMCIRDRCFIEWYYRPLIWWSSCRLWTSYLLCYILYYCRYCVLFICTSY